MNIIKQLYSERKELANVLKKYTGIRKIAEQLYPDRAHFLYELLQNAEDTSATEVKFFLKRDALIFEHNGRPFDEKDVGGITNIGEGTKGDQEDKIGRFGIGFKAVFAYTETPYIWSPTYSFKITELVLPYEIPPNSELGDKTRFEFPFNNPKKPPEEAYVEVRDSLKELAETTLLFLQNIESLGWNLGNGISGEVLRVQHSEHHVEVQKQFDNKGTLSKHFLLFSQPIEIDDRSTQNVSIAYSLEYLSKIPSFNPKSPLHRQLKIVPADPGCVAVFFPAEKESSGLRFHIHAPFVTELSRASIKETSANDLLFDQLAQLAASSLYKIQDLGLLTGEFLGVLPNPQDSLPERYSPIRDAIIEVMINEPLTPTHSKSHAPAQCLLQARAALKDLITEKDLTFLIKHEYGPWQWAIAATQRSSNQDRFLAGLKIKAWDVEQFVDLLNEKLSVKEGFWERVPDERFIRWISEKSIEWHQQMYTLLHNYLTSSEYFSQRRLRDWRRLKIVRLSNDKYDIGSECYFPSDGVDHDEIFPRVDRMIYESKKKGELDNIKEFLTKIGVREVGESEEIEGILKSRYTHKAEIPNKETYFKDLVRFVQLVEHDRGKAALFDGYWIFKTVNDEWRRPQDIFLDSPYEQTGLSAYYGALENDELPKALSKKYQKCGIEKERLVEFAKSVGVVCQLPISEVRCYNNPQWDYLKDVPGERSTSPINRDYQIEGLPHLLKSRSLELSKLVWGTMYCLDERFLCAIYGKNQSSGYRTTDSQLVHLLKDMAWVPQKNGDFVRPCDATRDQLPKGFPFNEGQEWLTKVEFGKTFREQSEEYQRRNEQAQEFGFPSANVLETAREIVTICEQMGKTPDELLSELKSEANKGKPEFPEKAVANPKRRKEGITKQLIDAPKKEYEPRERSVRSTGGAIDPDPRLKDLYTNEIGQMICQVCQEEMPFRKRDGEYYFEAVEALSGDHFPNEHESQFLALCPLCAAMYKEFIKRDKDAMEVLKNALMSSDNPEVLVQLGVKKARVKFVKVHFHDIKAALDFYNPKDIK